jgi:hypothetical protein
LPLQPIWVSSDSGGAMATSSGFRAIGTISPAELNGGIGGSISLAVSRSRVVTGSLTMGAPGGQLATYRFRGSLTQEGKMEISIPRRMQTNLTLYLELDLNNAPSYFKFNSTSRLVDGDDLEAPVKAAIVPWSRTQPAADFGGAYTVGLNSAPLPGQSVEPGYGFLSLTITPSTGAARIAGVLADGTRFTTASSLLGTDGQTETAKNAIPLWVPLYSRLGTLSGDLEVRAFRPGRPVSTTLPLLWRVPRSPDPEGFKDVPVTATAGSGLFVQPAVAAFDGLTLSFNDGSPLFSQAFDVVNKRIIAVDPQNNLKITWNLRSGLFQGTFMVSGFGLSRFQGVMLNNASTALKLRGNFQMPDAPIQPTEYIGGSVSN